MRTCSSGLRIALILATSVASIDCDAVLGIHQLDGGTGVDVSTRPDSGSAPDVSHADSAIDATSEDGPGDSSRDSAVDARLDRSVRDAIPDTPRDSKADSTDGTLRDAPMPVLDATDGHAPDAGCGTLAVTVTSDFNVITDQQGVFAIRNGLQDWYIPANSTVYATERAKVWSEVGNELIPSRDAGPPLSACLPPGDYELEYWDIASNGVPPDHNAQPWQIGLSSMTVAVAVGVTTTIGVTPTESNNVPSSGNFHDTWISWEYGTCSDAGVCASSKTTCYQGVCYDMAYDVRNCGVGGHGCNGMTCCGGACVNTASDPLNCGSCGNACVGAQVCASSTTSEGPAGACQ